MNLFRTIFILNLIFLHVLPLKSAKILGIFPIRSRSHQSIHLSIIKALASKGHEVTVISHFKSNHTIPNYKEILIAREDSVDFIDSIDIEDGVNFAGINFIKSAPLLELQIFGEILNLQYVKQLINSKEKHIDLIITEVHSTKFYHLLAHSRNVPLILVSPLAMSPKTDHFVGNLYNPSITPYIFSEFSSKMNFLQRLTNTFYYAMLHWYQDHAVDEYVEKYAREVFNMEMPSDEELNKRTALALYNNHLSFISRPKTPNAIDIAGIHIEEPKKLPQDVEDFIEGSDHGVIFFSFGTTIKASSMSPKNLKIIMDTFSEIPQRVLWRVDKLNITEVPTNVKLGKWFPQRDILEHKNVIGFISHGGLLGTLEAIHTATPIIAIPFAFDQFLNANVLVEQGVGIYVDYFTMNKSIFTDAINQIVTNTKYRENMQKLSRVFKDRPMPPLDEAVYWIEYVLKHKGAPHLRTEAADMPLYQYVLLDVLLFLLAIVIGIVYFCKFLFKIIIFRLCGKELKKNKIQ